MVNVHAFLQLASVAIALCAASTTAADASNTPARQLQLDDESVPPPSRDPGIGLPIDLPLVPALLPTPSPTPDPSSPEPVTDAPVVTTNAPDPTDIPVPEPTTETPEPTTETPEPTLLPTLLPPLPTILPPLPTILPPLPTTAAPEPTTAAPEPTTAAPEPTTTAPEPTTAAPEPTTVAPEATTAAPEPTTAAPTLLPPLPTLLPPLPTTAAPEPTTAAPEPTTAGPTPVPDPTTAGPTVSPPLPTTAAPEPTTPAPEPTTAGPTLLPPLPTTAGPTASPEPTTVGPTASPEPTTAGPTTSPEPTTAGPTTSPAPPTALPETTAPPLITIMPATEDPTTGTPEPASTKKKTEAPVTEMVDNSQANKKDIITFNSTSDTEAPKANPFEIKEINTDAPKPVVLDIREDGAETEAPKLYVRGDTKTKAPSSGSGSNDSTGESEASTPNIIGGSRRNTATTAESILTKTSQSFHDFLRYAAAAFSGISVALLLFFHFVSLDATLTWTSSLWSPNTWEFILYVTYLQQMASVSQLTLLKTPYYLWDYADSFAWTNFLIQRTTSSDGRRLETIVLGGVVAYADRIGVDESKIVFHAVVGFAVVLAVLLVLFLVIAVFAKRKAEQALDDPMNLHESSQSVHRLRSASIRTLGLCVLIWYFALYPLSVFASFEISMEIQAKAAVASALFVSILAIGVVCFGVLAWSGRVIMQKSKDELLQFENMATWGSLYAEFSFRSRMFFILGALVQIVTGIVVGTMDSDPTQLIIVIIIEILYLVAVFVLTPFAETLVLRFTYALGLLKVVNYSLAFAFLNSNGMTGTGRNSVANVFIGINTIIIIAWFIRQLIVFSTYIRAWSVRTSFVEESANGHDDSTTKFETRTATDSDVYASVATARHGDGGLSVGSDDYHKGQREIHY